jgi:hypothetical protein
VTYLSFNGETLGLRREVPVGIVYESSARPADHRVKGDMQGSGWSALGQ